MNGMTTDTTKRGLGRYICKALIGLFVGRPTGQTELTISSVG